LRVLKSANIASPDGVAGGESGEEPLQGSNLQRKIQASDSGFFQSLPNRNDSYAFVFADREKRLIACNNDVGFRCQRSADHHIVIGIGRDARYLDGPYQKKTNSAYKSTSWSIENNEAAIFFSNLRRERISVNSARRTGC
jgi:hypothetical protein